jgi:hypothetical protein
MAVWNRQRVGCDLDQLVHHSDRGVQYLSIRYSERLAANAIVASVAAAATASNRAACGLESAWPEAAEHAAVAASLKVAGTMRRISPVGD